MSQFLNLVIDKTKVRIIRSRGKESDFIQELAINLSDPFFSSNLQETIRKVHNHPEQIRIFFSPEKYTLIPSTIFSSGNTENYYHLNFGEENADESINHEFIDSIGITFVYAIPKWIIELKNRINSIGQVLTTLAKNAFILNYNIDLNSISCFVDAGFVDIIVKSTGKLTLVNHYEIQTEEYLIYFLLLITKRLSISSNANLFISNLGNSINNDKLENYIKSIQELSGFAIQFNSQENYFKSLLCE
jgi:hypothetical protein